MTMFMYRLYFYFLTKITVSRRSTIPTECIFTTLNYNNNFTTHNYNCFIQCCQKLQGKIPHELRNKHQTITVQARNAFTQTPSYLPLPIADVTALSP